MLNHNKRSITIDGRNPQGKAVLEALVKTCDVMVENFAPGALDRMGFTWEHIQSAEPAHDPRLGEGLRSRPVRGLQGLRERRAMRRWRRIHHRLRRRPAAGHRRADRRLRHRPASGPRHRLRAVPAQHHRPRPEGAVRDAGRRAEPVPRETARPAAPRARTADRISAVSRWRIRRCRAARGQRIGRRPARLDPEMQRLGDRSQRLHLLHLPGAGVGSDLRRDRQAGMEDRSRTTPSRPRACHG